jgi:hypothetical protein
MSGMPIYIVDGYGSGNKVKVNGEGEISVVIHTHPPIDEEVSAYPFSQFFTDDGTASGSNDMRVDGSTTPQEFYISAQEDMDLYIKTISVRIADQSAVLNKYGNLTALTNGIDWKFRANVLGDVSLRTGIKTNLDFVRMGISTPSIGSGSDSFRADVSGSSADTYLIVIDMAATFGFPWGLRLEKASRDRISFVVNDDLSTGMDGHDIFAFGAQL